MKNIRKLILLLFFNLLSTAYANGLWQYGVISGFIPPYKDKNNKEVFLFKLKDNIRNSCNTTARFAIDSKSTMYKSTLAAITNTFYVNQNIKN